MKNIRDMIPEVGQKDSLTSSTKSQDETSKKTGLPMIWVSGIFKKFQARYGHKWVSALEWIEEIAVQEWSIGLAGLSNDDIKRGLDSWAENWPPSLPEFRAACLGKSKLNEFGLDYVPEYHRPEARITDRTRLLSSDAREAKREGVSRAIASLRAAIRGKH